MTFVPNLVIFSPGFLVRCIVCCRTKKGLYKGFLLKRKRTASSRLRESLRFFAVTVLQLWKVCSPSVFLLLPF